MLCAKFLATDAGKKRHSLLGFSFLGTTTGLSAAASVPSPWLVEVRAAPWTAGALEMLSMAAASSPVAAILFLFGEGGSAQESHEPSQSRDVRPPLPRSRALPRPDDARSGRDKAAQWFVERTAARVMTVVMVYQCVIKLK